MAHKTHTTPEEANEVPDVSEQDVSDTVVWREGIEAAVDSEIDELLKPFGADSESLEQKGIHEQLRSLLNAATEMASDSRLEKVFDNETVKNEAMNRMAQIVLINRDSMYRLFEVLQIDSPQGLRDIEALKNLNTYLQLEHLDGNYNATATLYEFLDVARKTLETEADPKANYLVSERLVQYLGGQVASKETKRDVDKYVPFEITKELYAAFSSDGDRIFVADEEMSQNIRGVIRSGWTKEYSGEEGYDLPSYKYESIPEDLLWATDEVIDAGTPLDKIAREIGIDDPDIITDYITVLRSSSREVIETKFGFRLTSLNIKEQLYFLSYLKNRTVEEAQSVQSFTSRYGVDGMRTFLSLEREDSRFGDMIIDFATQNPEAAHRVFEAYGKLLDAADSVGEQIAQMTHLSEGERVSLTESTRKTVLDRAHSVLTTSVTSKDPEKVAELLEHVSKEGIIYASTTRNLYATRKFSFEQMKDTSFGFESADDLSPEDIVEMERLYKLSYQGERFHREGFTDALVDKFHRTLTDPDMVKNTRWHVLRHKGKPIGFCKFTDVKDESGTLIRKHFGGFNVNQQYGQGKIGEAMLLSIIALEEQDKVPIVAECIPDVAISSKYIEDAGFNAVGIESFHGVPLMHIRRDIRSVDDPDKELDPKAIVHVMREIDQSDSFSEFQSTERVEMTRLFRHEGRLYGLFRRREGKFGPTQKAAA